MTNNITPLQALADVMAEPEQIKSLLTGIAQKERRKLLVAGVSKTSAKASIAVALEEVLRGRFFSRFAKKRMLDRVIADAMSGYDSALRAMILEGSAKARADGDVHAVNRIRRRLASGSPGKHYSGLYRRGSK